MNVGIMQPYFFPYIGYWQLMALTDRYVIYDDVNFIKGGWIGRNRILTSDGPSYINVPLRHAGSNRKIMDVGVDITPQYLRKAGNKLTYAYHRAPYFDDVYPFIMDILKFQTDSLPEYLENSIRKTAGRLGITSEFIRSSDFRAGEGLCGQERVIAICRALGADTYYNAIGGRELYSFEAFEHTGITLRFVEAGDVRYRQCARGPRLDAFYPNLSIIDVLMNVGWDGTRTLLDNRIAHGAEGRTRVNASLTAQK